MNSRDIGNLIKTLRLQKNLTQQQLADELFVSAKTISKWECGNGCPDISLIPNIAQYFSVDIQQFLSGVLEKDKTIGGNMKRIKFYVCPDCANVVTNTGNAIISCCGHVLEPCKVNECLQDDKIHSLAISEMDDELCVKFNHEMTKDNYVRFIAWVNYDIVIIKKLYPEQESRVIFPKVYKGVWYMCSSKDGLYKNLRLNLDEKK